MNRSSLKILLEDAVVAIDNLPEVIADRLMTNGNGDAAQRLVLELPDGRDGGGECRQSVVNIIKNAVAGCLLGGNDMHTPGPWHIKGSFIFGPHHESVADMLQWNDDGPGNAALIVRAPDLLAENEKLRVGIERIVENPVQIGGPSFLTQLRELLTNSACKLDPIR